MIPGLLRSNKAAGLVIAAILVIVLFFGLAHTRIDTWDFNTLYVIPFFHFRSLPILLVSCSFQHLPAIYSPFTVLPFLCFIV